MISQEEEQSSFQQLIWTQREELIGSLRPYQTITSSSATFICPRETTQTWTSIWETTKLIQQ